MFTVKCEGHTNREKKSILFKKNQVSYQHEIKCFLNLTQGQLEHQELMSFSLLILTLCTKSS